MTHLVAFAEGLDVDPGELPEDWESQLASGFEVLEANWEPSMLDARREPFCRWLGKKCEDARSFSSWLGGLHLSDLFLAFAVGQSDPEAVRELREKWVLPAARRIASPSHRADELAAVVLAHLVVSVADHEARILSYSGRGPLTAWVHMVSRRKSIEMARGVSVKTTEAEDYLKRSTAVLDPELDLLKFRYAKRFNEALELALRELPASDANLLYLTGVKRVSLGAVAKMEGVSVRTIQRRIGAVRTHVFEDTKRAREFLQASDAEMSSLLALVQSQLDVTLHRVLAPAEPSATED